MVTHKHWSIGPCTEEDDDRDPNHGPVKLVIYGDEKYWPVIERSYHATYAEAVRVKEAA